MSDWWSINIFSEQILCPLYKIGHDKDLLGGEEEILEEEEDIREGKQNDGK